jgi:hypothetical protein
MLLARLQFRYRRGCSEPKEKNQFVNVLNHSVQTLAGSMLTGSLVKSRQSAEVTRSRFGGKLLNVAGVVVTERKLFILPAFESKKRLNDAKAIAPVDSVP